MFRDSGVSIIINVTFFCLILLLTVSKIGMHGLLYHGVIILNYTYLFYNSMAIYTDSFTLKTFTWNIRKSVTKMNISKYFLN